MAAQRLDEVGALPSARESRDRLDQHRAVLHAPRIVGKARVVRQAGRVEGASEPNEQRVGPGGDHHVAVGGRERLVGRDHRGARALGHRRLARRQIAHGVIRDPHQRRLEERRRDFHRAPRAIALAQRRDDAKRGPHPGAHVDDRRAHAHRFLAGMAVDRHEPGVGLHHRVVARHVAQGAARSEGGDRAVDEPGVHRRRADKIHPEIAGGFGAQALDEDVDPRDEPLQHRATGRRLQIEGEAPLVAVEGEKRRRLIAPPRRRPRARVVPAPGPLDLDHVGPHVAEHLRAERTGDVLREVGDDDAFERERHAESLPPRSVPDFPWHQRSKLSH